MQVVERAKEYIAAGDIFQVVPSQRMDFVPGVAPFDLYRASAHGQPVSLPLLSSHGER